MKALCNLQKIRTGTEKFVQLDKSSATLLHIKSQRSTTPTVASGRSRSTGRLRCRKRKCRSFTFGQVVSGYEQESRVFVPGLASKRYNSSRCAPKWAVKVWVPPVATPKLEECSNFQACSNGCGTMIVKHNESPASAPTPNPSIKRTCPGKPGHAAYLKR